MSSDPPESVSRSVASPSRGVALALATLLAIAAPIAAADESPIPPSIGHLEFLGEVQLPPLDLDGVPLGGLSGITYDPSRHLYYAISDDRAERGPARFYTLTVDLSGGTLQPRDVHVLGMTSLTTAHGHRFGVGRVDLEAIALDGADGLIISSEGDARHGLAPFLRRFSLQGRQLADLPLPRRYRPRADHQAGVRNNLALESASIEPGGRYLFSGTENALYQDGPSSSPTQPSPGRLLVYDLATGTQVAEHLYWIEPVAEVPEPPEAFSTSGLVDLIAVDRYRLLSLERSFSVGRGYTISLYEVDLTGATDIRDIPELSRVDTATLHPVHKRLLLSVDRLGIEPDNLEGMTLGPRLSDGRRTLLLISDDNFDRDRQATQLLAFALDGPTPGIGRIQGSGHRSPLDRDWVRGVTGIVTAVERGDGQGGFWIEAPATTSGPTPGIFVTPPAAEAGSALRPGDRVAVDGAVREVGFAGALTVTRIDAARLDVLEHGLLLPPPVVLGRGALTPPPVVIDDDEMKSFDPCCDAIDFYESLEGTLVEVRDAVAVSGTTGYGEIAVVAGGGRPGSARTSAGGVRLRPGDPNPERILLDGRLAGPAPNVRVGDRFAGPIRGVFDYSFGNYKLLVTRWPPVIAATRDSEAIAETETMRPGELTVATYNVLNLDLSDGEAKYRRLALSLIEDLGAPALVGLQEVQDDDGAAGETTVSAVQNLSHLVDTIVAAGGPAYRFQQIDPLPDADGGQPHGNIRVAWLYDPERVELERRGWEPGIRVDAGDEGVEARVQPADDGSPRLERSPALLGTRSPAFAGDPTRGWTGTRKCLVGEAYPSGRGDARRTEPLFVINCHLKSKRGDDRFFGPVQPPRWRSEEQRAAQSRDLRRLVESILELDPEARIILLGDMNEHEFRSPIRLLEGPLVDLVAATSEADRYTYNFEGNSQVLDHVLVSPALASRVRFVSIPHVNADRPDADRTSDHDPVLIGLATD